MKYSCCLTIAMAADAMTGNIAPEEVKTISNYNEKKSKQMELDNKLKLVVSGEAEADNVEGTLEELIEILSAMHPSVEKRQPKPCKPFIKMLNGKSWPESVAPAVADLNTMIKRYKFKEALELLERLMEKLYG